MSRNTQKFIHFVTFASIVMLVYISARFFFFFAAHCPWYESLFAILFLSAESFVLCHNVTYFFNVIAVLRKEEEEGDESILSQHSSFPPIVVVLCSYKEPLDIIEKGLLCLRSLDYPNKRLYVLDDSPYEERPWDTPEVLAAYKKSLDTLCKTMGVNLFRRKWRNAKAGMVNDFLDFLIGLPHLGSHALQFQPNMPKEKPKYLVVFDVDMNPLPNFLHVMVEKIEKDPKLAFVQTPQYYTNIDDNHMAKAAGMQQVVFYDYICKAKAIDKAIFCCGTNFIMRVSTLLEVGGFDETCVTEDFATSLNMHLNGWDSSYFGKVLCFGEGPTDLSGYLIQQGRWAHGTLDVGRKTVFEFFKDWHRVSVKKWWSYFISCSYYLCGIAFLVLFAMPSLFLFFNIQSYFFNPYIYAIICAPYLCIILSAFILTLMRQGYKFRSIFYTLIMLSVSFPQIVRASIRGMLKKPVLFHVTPKGKYSSSYTLLQMWPQMLSCLLCAVAAAWGCARFLYGDDPFLALFFNVVWLFVHVSFVAPIIYFNHPVEESA